MTRSTKDQLGGQNVAAFLDMLAASEIGPALLSESDDGYNVLVGSTPSHPLLFTDYSHHPNVFNQACDSTAAGRYQLLHRYAIAYIASLNLPDFSPISQDAIAVRQIKERGALPHIIAGNFAVAVQLCSNIWASLPGNNYGQHANSLTMLQAAYVAAGGTLSEGST
jgi:muramidase (phage lysozyme)